VPPAPSSLSGRLVATAVALVAVVSIAFAAFTTIAMHDYLTECLEEQVDESLDRAVGAFLRSPKLTAAELRGDEGGPTIRIPTGQGSGTLTAYFYSTDRGGNVVPTPATAARCRAPRSMRWPACPSTGRTT
jgi:hypothetical protein